MPSYQFEGHSVAGAPKKSSYSKNENYSHSANYSRYYQNYLPDLAEAIQNGQATIQCPENKDSSLSYLVNSPETGFTHSRSDQVAVSTSMGIDYATVSFEFPTSQMLREFLVGIYGDQPYIVEEIPIRLSAGKKYDYSIRGQASADGGYSLREPEDNQDAEKVEAQKIPVRGGYDTNEHGNYVGFLQLSGKYWERLSIPEMGSVLSHVSYYQCDYSRLDLRIDDWSKSIFPYLEMWNAYDRGDKAGFKYASYKREDDKEGRKFKLGLGSRQSETYTRVYNHIWKDTSQISDENVINPDACKSVDNGNVESYRYEVEFHRKKANKVANMLLSLFQGSGDKPNDKPNVGIWKGKAVIDVGDRVWVKPDNTFGTVIGWDDLNEAFQVELDAVWNEQKQYYEIDSGKRELYYPNQLKSQSFNQMVANKIGSICISQVDFVAKSNYQGKRKSPNKKDCKRLEFWQKVIDLLGQAEKITVTRKAPSLERTLNWLRWGVSGMLATLYEGMGDANFEFFIAWLIGEGKSRMQDRHYMIADAVANDVANDKFEFLV